MNDRRLSAGVLWSIAAMSLFLSLFVLFASMERLLTVIPDDAAYYFGIARNAAAGAGLTFDGINRTNGFQPLWLAVLVPVFRLVHGTPETMVRIVLLLQVAGLAVAALIQGALVARFFGRRTALLSLLLFLFFVFVPAANGMESAVLVLALTIALFYGSRTELFTRRDPKRQLLLGALLAVVVLARLDMIFVLAVALAALFGAALRARGARRERLAGSLLVAAGAAALVGPYLLFNRESFGAVMPISGLLKSSFPHLSSPAYGLSSLDRRGALGLLCAAAYAAYVPVRRLRRGNVPDPLRGFRTVMAVMAYAILLHFVHALFFMKWAVFNWHYLPYVLFATLAVAEPAERVLSAAGPRPAGAAFGLALVAIAAAGSFATYRLLGRPVDRDWRPASYRAALWAREHTAPDAIFAMKDAGNFGYFSLRRVVNLDGVVNNLEYQAALREKSLRAYLAIKGVDYLVQHAFWERPDVTAGTYDSLAVSYRSHRYESDSDTIVLRGTDEVYRSHPYFDGPYETVFVIWRLREAGGEAGGSAVEPVEVPVLVRVAAGAEENGLPVPPGE
jgi:hypothetical protein